jgi:hypothetical protein
VRRNLQLTLAAVLATACTLDKSVRRPECVEPGDVDADLMTRAQAELLRGDGRFPLDKEGCRFISVTTDGGVKRAAMEEFHGSQLRISYESLTGPDGILEHADSDADGVWNTVTVTRFGDAGWSGTQMVVLEEDGGFSRRYSRTRIDALQMKVVQDVWGDGGWQLEDDFETSIIQKRPERASN